MKISRRRNGQLVVSYQVMTDPCCGLSVIFCGFILHLIGHETINIPEIFSSVQGFTGKTVKLTKVVPVFKSGEILTPIIIVLYCSSLYSLIIIIMIIIINKKSKNIH